MASVQATPHMIEELKRNQPITPDRAEHFSGVWGISTKAISEICFENDIGWGECMDEVEPDDSHLKQQTLAGKKAEKVIDYIVLSSKTQAGLVREVKEYISIGFHPIGGVSAAAFGVSPVGGNQYIQAMAKYG